MSCHLSQHGSGFKKPIEIRVREFGTRLKYENTEEFNLPRGKKRPRFFIEKKK